MTYVFNCPVCNQEVEYRSQPGYERAIRLGTPCKSCRERIRDEQALAAKQHREEPDYSDNISYAEIRERVEKRARRLIWGETE